MCSGCSGNHADDDYAEFDALEPEEAGKPVQHQWLGAAADAENEPRRAPEELWEVLVSARGIVEIYFVPVPDLPAPDLPSPRLSARDLPQKIGRADSHSERESAKYYRTRSGARISMPPSPPIALLCFGLAALAWALLALWLVL